MLERTIEKKEETIQSLVGTGILAKAAEMRAARS